MVRKSFTDQMTWEQRTKGVGLVLSCAKIWNVPEALSGKGTGLETCLELLKDIRKPGRCSQRDTVVLWYFRAITMTVQHVHII